MAPARRAVHSGPTEPVDPISRTRYVDRMRNTVAIVRREMAAGKDREQIQRERPLRDYVVWGEFFPVIAELKDIGVEKVAATHCTGDRAVELFREAWGEEFVEALCGSVWECPGR